MKTIAIWAPLRFTNYGDDMQALAFASLLKSMGYKPRLYQLDKSLAKIYDVESVHSVKELCEGVNLCVIAGGGLLTPFSILRRTLSHVYSEFELMFKDLCWVIDHYNTKFVALSIGGDGKMHSPKLMYGKWRRNFLSSPNLIGGTVRLEGDVLQMRHYFGKDFKYYPDMLMKASDYFSITPYPPKTKIKVVLNFKKNRNYKYLDKKFLSDLFNYANRHDNIEFHFVTTHLKSEEYNYQYLPKNETDNLFIDRYKTPSQLLSLLASCDFIISSMLHVGLTGLSCGTPLLSYRGPGKTKSFLKSVGGEWAILDDDIPFKKLLNNFLIKDKNEIYNNYNIEALVKMKQESSNHYDYCKEIVERYA